MCSNLSSPPTHTRLRESRKYWVNQSGSAVLVYSGSDGAYRFFRHCTEMKIAPVRPMHRSIRNKGMDQTPLSGKH